MVLVKKSPLVTLFAVLMLLWPFSQKEKVIALRDSWIIVLLFMYYYVLIVFHICLRDEVSVNIQCCVSVIEHISRLDNLIILIFCASTLGPLSCCDGEARFS